MGNSKLKGITAESEPLDYENDRANIQNKSATSSQEKVALRYESKYSLVRNAPDVDKRCTEKLRFSDSADEFVKSSPMNRIKGDSRTGKVTNWEISGLSKDSCDQQYMEWIKLRGAERRSPNKMEELSKAQRLKCWKWKDTELILDKAPGLALNKPESDDRFELRSKDFPSFVGSDSCFKDARSCDKDAGSFSRVSELSAAIGPISVERPDVLHGGADSPSPLWNQDPSSDESVKYLYCLTTGNGFEKELPKHTEYKESAHRIEFKPSFTLSSTQLGVSGKKAGSPKVLRPYVKVNQRAPVLLQNPKADQ